MQVFSFFVLFLWYLVHSKTQHKASIQIERTRLFIKMLTHYTDFVLCVELRFNWVNTVLNCNKKRKKSFQDLKKKKKGKEIKECSFFNQEPLIPFYYLYIYAFLCDQLLPLKYIIRHEKSIYMLKLWNRYQLFILSKYF